MEYILHLYQFNNQEILLNPIVLEAIVETANISNTVVIKLEIYKVPFSTPAATNDITKIKNAIEKINFLLKENKIQLHGHEHDINTFKNQVIPQYTHKRCRDTNEILEDELIVFSHSNKATDVSPPVTKKARTSSKALTNNNNPKIAYKIQNKIPLIKDRILSKTEHLPSTRTAFSRNNIHDLALAYKDFNANDLPTTVEKKGFFSQVKELGSDSKDAIHATQWCWIFLRLLQISSATKTHKMMFEKNPDMVKYFWGGSVNNLTAIEDKALLTHFIYIITYPQKVYIDMMVSYLGKRLKHAIANATLENKQTIIKRITTHKSTISEKEKVDIITFTGNTKIIKIIKTHVKLKVEQKIAGSNLEPRDIKNNHIIAILDKAIDRIENPEPDAITSVNERLLSNPVSSSNTSFFSSKHSNATKHSSDNTTDNLIINKNNAEMGNGDSASVYSMSSTMSSPMG